ncbi:hypothetical protein [Deinococcus gobiensis]|uniref:Uncharacterized protein n=1 Tax=Deinococcus gobiensis (strain DSM 21396 / JCM 16679 / CGMCC 1.7299 / I-0) TaxID=745776 RepID=H8GX76_DEIGI|nr:hypothetical protein [Deinococcus gobiensis]AFD25805.1 hypothetical protein DGo_CA1878 [Deinococcus gobiensis I-0]
MPERPAYDLMEVNNVEKIAGPSPKKKRAPQPELYLGSITTGSGVDIHSPEGKTALFKALLSIAPKPQAAPKAG